VPALFHTGGALGIRPSELPPHGRYPVRFRPEAPTCRFFRRCSRPPKRIGRPNGPRLLGFDPSESPWRPDAGLARQPLAAPLGFTLLGPAGDDLARDFARTPPARFAPSAFRPPPRAPRSFDQPSPDSARRPASRSDGQNSPFRVPAPARLRTLKRGFTLAMCSPCAASRVTANCPTRFG
jgi:hypothetical protein